MKLVYVRMITLADLEAYANGSNPGYPASVAEEALNILLGQAVKDSNEHNTDLQKPIQIGDNYFFMQNTGGPLQGWGMTALRGYTSHVKARQGDVYLNVNTALSAFYMKGTVHQHIRGFAKQQYPQGFLSNPRAKQHLIGLRVRITYNRDKPGEIGSTKDTEAGRLKTITGFSDKPADQIFFTDRHGQNVSVWTHFENDHPELAAQSFSKQICINTSSTHAGRECWILSDQVEVVPGQIYRKTLDKLDPTGTMTATMIELAARRPQDNQQSIEKEGMLALGFPPNGSDPTRLVEAGLEVSRRMLDVPARQIPSPAVRYGQGDIQVTAGQWRTRDMKFLSQDRGHFKGTTGIAFFCPPSGLGRPQHADAYIDGFRRAWQMNYYDPQKDINVGPRWNTLRAPGLHDLTNVTRAMQASRAGLVVLALPSANSAVRPSYANFRIAMDQIIGKPSPVICEDRMVGSVRLKTGQHFNGQALIPYFANVAMKLNVRLGNTNHTTGSFISLSPGGICDTMALGADLIHPKPTSSDVTPTVACIAASIDGNFAKFLGSARRQKEPRTDIIDSNNMVDMVKEALGKWKAANSGRMPSRILYYRDGTGESQYAGILSEVAAIKTAWQNVTGEKRSTEVVLTAIVAIKRHTTRFYPPRDASYQQKTKTGNCIPGLVVQDCITNPYFFDFFLQSHDVEVGSAKSTHYKVLHDDFGYTSATLQDLTNAFCYNFSHSASAVSYASPAYYADRLCERTMLYLREFFDNDQDVQNLGSDNARQSRLDTAWGRGGQGMNGNPWHKNFNNVMFWM